MTLTDMLEPVSTKDLLRAINTDKEYIVFNYHVTNSGSVVSVHCTNDYGRYNKYLEDGYSFILSLYSEEYETIKEILLNRLNSIVTTWTQNCYYYSFQDHLQKYKISEYNYYRLRRLQND